jgi:sec-independent protein translocase protein TatB
MFDLAWSELAIIAIVALLVIGPKDLPKALRTVGYYVRKARMMASEFQTSVDQMARESELQELKEKLDKATRMDVEGEIRKAVDPDNKLADAFAPPSGTMDISGPPQPAATADTIASMPAPEPVYDLPAPPPAIEPTPVKSA